MRTPFVAALAALAVACQSESRDPVAWDEITGKPSTFPSTWTAVAEKPSSYPTTWPEIAGTPATFPSTWDEIAGKPLTFPTTWADIVDPPSSFPSTWDAVSGKPATFPAAFGELTGVPSSFPSDWSSVANKPSTFPTDPSVVQARVSGSCADGAGIAAVNADGSVTCAVPPSRPVTVQLPAATWGTSGCSSVSPLTGLGGVALPSLRLDPTGACGTVRNATAVASVPLELPAGPRPFRVRAIVTVIDFPGAVGLWLDWRVPTAGSGSGSFACYGQKTLTVPAMASVQAMTSVEFDFRADPALCGQPGDPIVLLLQRTDGAANRVFVHALHAVFE